MNEKILYYANLIEQFCKQKEPIKRKFTVKAFMFFNSIPKQDIGKVAYAIKLLHSKGKLKRFRRKVWEWQGDRHV